MLRVYHEVYVNINENLANTTFCWQVAAEVAAPLSQARKITMIASGNSDVGAAKLTGEVLKVMQDLPQLVQGMTGVDISKVRQATDTGGCHTGEVAVVNRAGWSYVTGRPLTQEGVSLGR